MSDPATEGRRNYERQREDERTAKSVDTVEVLALINGTSPLADALEPEMVSGAYEDAAYEHSGDDEELAESLLVRMQDDDQGHIWEEVERRADLLGEHYPFDVKRASLRSRAGPEHVWYLFCLAVSHEKMLSSSETKCLPIAFERLAMWAMGSLVGAQASEMDRTGWPRDHAMEDGTSRFRETVERLHAKTGEWHWGPQEGMPDNPDSRYVKDCGLDFVVWRALPDNRPPSLFFLGQCACGEEWDGKGSDLDPRLQDLGNWLNPVAYVEPVRVLAIPHMLSNRITLRTASKRAGLLLERTRIVSLASQSEVASSKAPDYLALAKRTLGF